MTTTKVTLEDITDTIFSRDNINKQQTYHLLPCILIILASLNMVRLGIS